MTYLEWLSKQDGHNAIVDLKNDIEMDDEFPRTNNITDMRRYFLTKSVPLKVFKVLFWSYGLYIQEFKKEVKKLESEFIREIEETARKDLSQ